MSLFNLGKSINYRPQIFKIIGLIGACLANGLWVISIDYPPSFEQMLWPLRNDVQLWLIRIVTASALLLATYLFARLLDKKARIYFWFFVVLSPAVTIITLAYPMTALAIFIIAILTFVVDKIRWMFVPALVVGISLLTVLHIGLLHQNPGIKTALSLKEAQLEAADRIWREDTITPHIDVPIVLRRIVYNKYNMVIKNVSQRSLEFFDFDSLFFQEVHPLDQKSVVLFFWPSIMIFLISIVLIVKRNILNQHNRALIFIGLSSWIAYIVDGGVSFQRLSVVIWLISLLMAATVVWLLSVHSKAVKIGTALLLVLIVYGYATNYYDRTIRPWYWLDNRPLVYQWLLRNAQKLDLKSYDAVYLTATIGQAENYCQYYFSDCHKITISDYVLLALPDTPNALYLGFIGNMYGPNSTNSFSTQYNDLSSSKHFTVLNETALHDIVAFRYGNRLLIGHTKP